MAQGSWVQSHPFIYLFPLFHHDSFIHLSAGPWLQFHHKSAEQTDEEEKRRGAPGGDKGLGILCGQLAKGSDIVLHTKEQWWKAVEMLKQRRNGNGCRDYESTCMCAPVHVSLQIAQICIQNMRFSLVKECHCSCPVGGCAWMNELSEQGHAKRPWLIRTACRNMQAPKSWN